MGTADEEYYESGKQEVSVHYKIDYVAVSIYLPVFDSMGSVISYTKVDAKLPSLYITYNGITTNLPVNPWKINWIKK